MITTGRYASKETRVFAKSLAKTINTYYASRGKKTIDILAKQARKNGETRICIIFEKNKKPCRLNFIEIKENSSWFWLQEEIEINET